MAFTRSPEDRFSTDIVVACDEWTARFDDPVFLAGRVLATAAAHSGVSGRIDVLLTDDSAMRTLNRRWRSRNAVTDILSFPCDHTGPENGFVGDLALGCGATAAGADRWERSRDTHLSHLLVHGFLHLLGYVHQSEAEEQIMQGKERDILSLFGIPDPYV